LLFVPIWLARQILRVFDIKISSEGQLNTRLLNRLLSRVFDFDVRTAPWLSPPFGVSIFVLARKPIETRRPMGTILPRARTGERKMLNSSSQFKRRTHPSVVRCSFFDTDCR